MFFSEIKTIYNIYIYIHIHNIYIYIYIGLYKLASRMSSITRITFLQTTQATGHLNELPIVVVVDQIIPSITPDQLDAIKPVVIHRENGGTLGMVPLIINSIYTLYSGYLLGFIGYIIFKRAPWGVKQLGYHPNSTTMFPMSE